MCKTISKTLCCLVLLAIWTVACNQSSTPPTLKAPDISVTTSSEEARAAFQTGLEYLDLGANDKARQAFTEAIQKDPAFSMAYLFRSNTSASGKDYAADIESAKKYIGGAGDMEKQMLAYEQTFIDNNWDQRLAICQKLVQDYPDIARFQNMLGNTFQEGNQSDKARVCYQKVIELAPNWTGGYLSGMNNYIYIDPKDFKKAETFGLKVVELAPNSPSAHVALGDCYRAQNDLQKALGAYTKAIELAPTDATAVIKKGHINTFLGNMEDARKDYIQAGKFDSAFQIRTLMWETYTWLYAGEHQKGLDKLIEIANNPAAFGVSDAQLPNLKASCLDDAYTVAFHLGQTATMQTLLPLVTSAMTEEFEALHAPEYKPVVEADHLRREALAAAQTGAFDVATNKLEEMKTKLEPVKDPRKLQSYNFAAGYLNLKQKKYKEAIGLLQQANQDQVYTRYLLATAYELAGEKETAMDMYRKIADYNFNSVGYALIRSEVKKKLAAS